MRLIPYADVFARRGQAAAFGRWPVVGVAAFGLFLSMGTIVVLSFGVYVKPLGADFHASRTAISLAFTIQGLVTAICIPWFGRLIDRLGARIVIVGGTVLFGIALVATEFVGHDILALYVLYAALGVVGSTTSPVPYGVIVSRWFDEGRGLALGFMASGLGLGAIVIPPLSQRLIASFGWRHTYAIFGIATLGLVLPVIASFLAQAPSRQRTLGATTTPAFIIVAGEPDGLTWREIWHEPAFWLMIGAYFLAALSLFGCIVHLPALMTDRGSTAAGAAAVSSVIGIALLAGRFGAGLFLDRVFAPRLAMLIFVGAGIGICILITGAAAPWNLVAALLLGLALGSELDIIAFMMSRYFGLQALGTAFASAFASYALASAAGVYLLGAAFDATHAYTLPLVGCTVSIVLAIILIGRLGPYRYAAVGAEEFSLPNNGSR